MRRPYLYRPPREPRVDPGGRPDNKGERPPAHPLMQHVDDAADDIDKVEAPARAPRRFRNCKRGHDHVEDDGMVLFRDVG